MSPHETDLRIFAEHSGRLEFAIVDGVATVTATATIDGKTFAKIGACTAPTIALMLRGFGIACTHRAETPAL